MVGRPRSLRLRIGVLLAVILLATTPALATTPPALTAGTAARTSDADTIHRTLTLERTPERSGSIAATATFDVPGDVRALETTLPEDATVTAVRGFTHESGSTYAWTGEVDEPSIRFTVPANETSDAVRASQGSDGSHLDGDRHRAARARRQDGEFSFVDTGPWALVTVPQLSTRWRYVGERVTLEKSVTVAGPGATGGEIAFLGEHRTVERAVNGQRFELVVPDAASLRESPADILDATTAASSTLHVGGRDDAIFMVAAPTSVEWAAAGIEYGGSDYWVKADEGLAEPRNVWLHEYVHTRQEYRPTSSTRWTVEAGAEYYAALLTLRQDRIGFPAFRRHLERGTREPVASAVLADPATWPSGTPYLKGALVYGNVDRQIRLDSDLTRSMQAVLSRMNSDPDEVTASEFNSFVAAAGTTDTAAYARRYVTTTAVPTAWTASEHAATFSELPARIGYETTSVRIHGPSRNVSLTTDTVVTTGETVVATVAVTNEGGASGTYDVSLYVDGTAVDATNGTVAASERRTVTLTHTFETPGQYTLAVADTTRTVVVNRPADPQVSELAVNATRDDGNWTATITVTLTNPTARRAHGTVPVTVDGSTIATLDVSLAPNASTTRTVTTPLSPGAHTVAAGTVSTTIDVPTSTPPTTPAVTPGFGVTAAGIAILLATLAARLE